MAAGDITSATVLGASPHDGWTLEARIAGWATATSLAIASGWTAPTSVHGNKLGADTPKGTLDLVSEGYSESGGVFTLGTRARAVYATTIVEMPFGTNAIAGAVAAGTFTDGETITQATSGATAVVFGAGQTTGIGALIAHTLTGTANDSDTWTGGTSGATFTPSAAPVARSLDYRENGTDLIVKVALSDYVYDDDASPTFTALAGLFTSSLGSSNAVADLAGTNNSTKDYPKVKAAWVDPPGGRIGATYTGRLACGHAYGEGQPVVGVQFTITDESSSAANHAVTTVSTEASTRFPTLPNIQCYKASASTTSLADGEGITVRARAYPFIGDADSIFDSEGETATHRRNRIHRLDRAGTFREVFAYVNPASPSGSPAASTTAATARAAPYSDIWEAVKGARDYINTNYAVSNSLEGATIRLMDNAGADQNFAWGRSAFASTMTAPFCMAIVEPDPLNVGTAQLRTKNTTANILCANVRFEGVTVAPATASQSNFFTSVGADDWLVFHQCDLVMEGTSTSALSSTAIENVATIECNIANWYTNVLGHSSVWSTISGQVTAKIMTNPGALMGFNVNATAGGNVYQSGTEPTHIDFSSAQSDGFIAFFEDTAATKMCFHVGHKLTNFYVGHGVFRRESGTEPMVLISADMEDCFFEHLSMVGQRYNRENEAASNLIFDRHLHRAIAARYIAFKYDVFAENAAITGGWPAMYGADSHGIYNGNRTFPPNFDGINAYTQDGSIEFGQVDVAIDATPTADSEVIGLIGSGRATSAYDLQGTAIPNDGTGAAGAIQLEAASAGGSNRHPRISLGIGLGL